MIWLHSQKVFQSWFSCSTNGLDHGDKLGFGVHHEGRNNAGTRCSDDAFGTHRVVLDLNSGVCGRNQDTEFLSVAEVVHAIAVVI